jgi:HlyD family secretion protein
VHVRGNWRLGLIAACAALISCGPTPPNLTSRVEANSSAPPKSPPSRSKTLRTNGTVQALESYSVRVPQITGQSSRVTLTGLIPNGSKVNAGDVVAEFDRTTILDEVLATEAKLAETAHQVSEKQAQIRSDRAKRESAIAEATAELKKAQLQLRKGPILSEIDRLKNDAKAKSATERLASLEKSGAFRAQGEEAALKGLELKRQRQQVTLERLKSNLERLIIKAPHRGMVALENVWKSGSMGPPQEGDQMWPGQPVLRLFNPEKMIVDASINESDFASVNQPGIRAKLYLDAYPGAEFEAEMVTASPIAVAGLDSPVRSFAARFRVMSEDPRLLPDLSAALEIPRLK